MNWQDLWESLPFDPENGTFLGHTLQEWVFATCAGLLAFVLLPLINRIVRKRADALSKHRRIRWLGIVGAVLQASRFWFFLSVSIWIGSEVLLFGDRGVTGLDKPMIVILLLQAAIWGRQAIQFIIDRQLEERLSTNPAEATTMAALGFVGRLVLYTVILLLILENIGVDVTALVAGLGVGGIAVALAAQNILGDLFSSMSIVLDKPFVLGNFIIVGDMMGTVQHIGLKTTRIRSLSGEQLVISNSDLLSSRIRNFKRMQERRVVFNIGVTYDTPRATLERIPGIIRDAIEKQEQTRFDRSHFFRFGDSSLIFESVYYVLSPDYAIYMNTQQAINLQIMEQFEALEVEFAFPTQTIHLQTSTPGDASLAAGETAE